MPVLSRQDKEELLLMLEEKEKRREENSIFSVSVYAWQKEFYDEGIRSKQRMLMAANRVGKTYSSCIELTFHLTGLYPDWWGGVKFDFPVNAWALGVSGEQIRDVLQNEMFGQLGREGFVSHGLVPSSLIGDITRSMTPKLSKDVKVKHITGGWSTLSFKSYSQGQHALMGSSVDYALIDEEPEDPEIYPQVVTRTATGNKGKGGYVVLSFTPENGQTNIINQFLTDIKPGQHLKNVTWADAPHLTEETKEQLLAAIPEYQRDMRTKGLPLLGSGQIFPISEERIKEEIESIPKFWPRIAGIDFGWDHPTAVVWMAWDRDNDCIYVYNLFRENKVTPIEVAAAMRNKGLWIPVSWPHDGLQHDKGSGQQLAEQYRDQGLNMLDYRATFEDGSNGVEAGLFDMLDRMKTGRLKVAAHLSKWFEEFRMYHRKDGKVVKERDDLMAATRYGIMMIRHSEVEPKDEDEEDDINYQEVSVMGY
jgi:phage terminase large subunit-like protein